MSTCQSILVVGDTIWIVLRTVATKRFEACLSGQFYPNNWLLLDTAIRLAGFGGSKSAFWRGLSRHIGESSRFCASSHFPFEILRGRYRLIERFGTMADQKTEPKVLVIGAGRQNSNPTLRMITHRQKELLDS